MRVLVVWDSEYPWDIRVEKICETLASRKWSVHLVCRNVKQRSKEDIYKGIFIHRVGFRRGVPRALNAVLTFPVFFNPIWVMEIIRVMVRHDIGGIIVRDLPLALAAIIAGRLRRTPVVLDMAECYPELIRAIWRYEPFRVGNVVVRNPALAMVVEWVVLHYV